MSSFNNPISPILLQRKCDIQNDITAEQWADIVTRRLAGEPVGFLGCGTWFQWYWGMNCVCPGCGRLWLVTIEDMNRFRVKEESIRINAVYEREMEDRILRTVLAHLGSRTHV